ncbi:DNA-directed RNA polymerase subunit omega [Candidatus Methylospira mobilis]|uniref:DNA-directed RNA polymerase subunit omega n=1 Tax=Candidatus Methylospira mobilis TaxID=1808979 RepID=A0A5Q0BGZ8_9GAMM|nr:DNA-directed RNA polymerase subunit omega [Candidatus Methylospira mobilis]QFY43145.1 DNA-directed RNA polymerase subunit omega [Candidatus Methylospira mobilis]WNV03655.1 DNA-directed RNA polymerase subunit omega [Candidatus Methylospira mobilis]
MARVTVEDCLDQVDNRFQLVLLGSKRARQLSRHPDDAKLPWDHDKPTVMALREIAAGLITRDYLKEAVKHERFKIERPVFNMHDDVVDLDDDQL